MQVERNTLVTTQTISPKTEKIESPIEKKTEKVKHRAITNFLIAGPVKAFTPAIVTLGGGALGLAVGGIPGALIGGAIGAQLGMVSSDKVAEVAGVIFDKGIDKAIEGIEFVAKKAVEGVTYLGKIAYEKVFGKKEEPVKEQPLEEIVEL